MRPHPTPRAQGTALLARAEPRGGRRVAPGAEPFLPCASYVHNIMMVMNCTKKRPRRAFGKRPPAPRKPQKTCANIMTEAMG